MSYRSERAQEMRPVNDKSGLLQPPVAIEMHEKRLSCRRMACGVLAVSVLLTTLMFIIFYKTGLKRNKTYFVLDEQWVLPLPVGTVLSMCFAFALSLPASVKILLTPTTLPMAFDFETDSFQQDYGYLSGWHSAQPSYDGLSMWQADEDSCQLVKYDLATFTETARVGSGDCSSDLDPLSFDKPTDMAESPSGGLFISDGEGANHRVLHIDSAGSLVWAAGAPNWAASASPGEFNFPHGLHLELQNDGNRLWVADRNNNRLQALNPATGDYLFEMKCNGILKGVTSVRTRPELGILYVLAAGTSVAEDMGNFFVIQLPNINTTSATESCTILQTLQIGLGTYPHQLAVDTSTEDVYVTSFYGALDANDNKQFVLKFLFQNP
jgi:hypothetical protein